MLKKIIASLVLSMVMLTSGSVFAWRETGLQDHTNGADCPGFYQGGSLSTYSGGWTQTNSTDRTGYHWTKRTESYNNSTKTYFYSCIKVINGGDWKGPQSLTSSYVKAKVTVRSKVKHIHKAMIES